MDHIRKKHSPSISQSGAVDNKPGGLIQPTMMNKVGVRNVKCPTCNKTFCSKFGLNIHSEKCGKPDERAHRNSGESPKPKVETWKGKEHGQYVQSKIPGFADIWERNLPKEDKRDVKDPVLVQKESKSTRYSSSTGVTNIARPEKEKVENGQKKNCKGLKIENEGEDKEHVKKETPRFACAICSQVLVSKEGFATHLQHHKNWCKTCNRGFLSQKALESHNSKHNKYICNKCPKSFANKTLLEHHQSEHTGVYKFSCPHCLKGFNRKDYFDSHINGHNQVYPYTCDVCQHKFTSPKNLSRHKLMMKTNPAHGTENKFLCTVCQQAFADRVDLNLHKKMHHEKGELPFICIECDVGYMNRRGLEYHRKKKHEGVKQPGKSKTKRPGNSKAKADPSQDKHEKEICNKDHVESKEDLTKCKGMHEDAQAPKSGDGGIKCPYCPVVVERRLLLKMHLTDKHPVEVANRLAGDEMVKLFSKKKSVDHRDEEEMKNSKEDSPREFICQVCNQEFTSQIKFEKHIGHHKEYLYLHRCGQCQKLFNNDEHLRIHLANKHATVGDLECVLCEKRFRSERIYAEHMKSHRLRGLKCRFCGKKFLQQSSLAQHEKLHQGESSTGRH